MQTISNQVFFFLRIGTGNNMDIAWLWTHNKLKIDDIRLSSKLDTRSN